MTPLLTRGGRAQDYEVGSKGRYHEKKTAVLSDKKNSLKFKILAFWRKKTPFIDQKCTYEKVTQKNWAGPSPPSFGQN